MKKIEVADIRDILKDIMTDEIYLAKVADKSDEELLKTDLSGELYLDSLDFADMNGEVEYRFAIHVQQNNRLVEREFDNNPTVENYIKWVNSYVQDV